MPSLGQIISNVSSANQPREEAIRLLEGLAKAAPAAGLDFNDVTKALSGMPGVAGFTFKVLSKLSAVGGAPAVLLILALGVFQAGQSAVSIARGIVSGASGIWNSLKTITGFTAPGIAVGMNMLSDESRDTILADENNSAADVAEILTTSLADLPPMFKALARKAGGFLGASEPAPSASGPTNPLAALGRSLLSDESRDASQGSDAVYRAALSMGLDPEALNAAIQAETSGQG